jgi:glycosyltransferase involved in cell wall biosynthesis
MNILFVNATGGWAGIKTWMLKLADFLSRRGHNVAMVCRERDLLITECAKRNLKCYPLHFGMDFSLRTIWWFLKIFDIEHTEVIVTNISKGIRTAGVAAKLKDIVHINRLGNYGDVKNTLKSRLLYNLLVDKVIVPSQGLFDFFTHYDFLRSKLCQFPNAVIPPPLMIPQNSVIKFAIVANLSKRKQVDKVLHVFSRLKDLPWEFHIGGDGPELEHLKTLTQELHLEQRVHFPNNSNASGFRKVDPYEFLKDKDVGILYSTREGLPNVLIEYMALSCAVIASNIEGIREVIKHNENGLLVDPHNLDELEKAIQLLIKDPQRKNELIRKGYETVQKHFHQDHVFVRVEEEIHQMISRV